MPRARSVLVCLNRQSGGTTRNDKDVTTIANALASTGIKAKVELCDGTTITKQAKAAAAGKATLMIVAGGDGSVSAAAGGLADTGTALGILPLGTRNHFARDLGIPGNLDKAAQLIASGKAVRVDIAALNDRTFVNNSAIGLYPLLVVDRDSQQDRLGRSKRLALAVASVRTLARFGHQRLTLTVNDQKERLETPLLFVGNNLYSLALPGAGRRERLDGGELSVLVMRPKTRRGFLTAVTRALVGRARPDDLERIDGVERLRVDSRRSRLTVSLDGEVLRLPPPLDYRIRKRALKVIAP